MSQSTRSHTLPPLPSYLVAAASVSASVPKSTVASRLQPRHAASGNAHVQSRLTTPSTGARGPAVVGTVDPDLLRAGTPPIAMAALQSVLQMDQPFRPASSMDFQAGDGAGAYASYASGGNGIEPGYAKSVNASVLRAADLLPRAAPAEPLLQPEVRATKGGSSTSTALGGGRRSLFHVSGDRNDKSVTIATPAVASASPMSGGAAIEARSHRPGSPGSPGRGDRRVGVAGPPGSGGRAAFQDALDRAISRLREADQRRIDKLAAAAGRAAGTSVTGAGNSMHLVRSADPEVARAAARAAAAAAEVASGDAAWGRVAAWLDQMPLRQRLTEVVGHMYHAYQDELARARLIHSRGSQSDVLLPNGVTTAVAAMLMEQAIHALCEAAPELEEALRFTLDHTMRSIYVSHNIEKADMWRTFGWLRRAETGASSTAGSKAAAAVRSWRIAAGSSRAIDAAVDVNDDDDGSGDVFSGGVFGAKTESMQFDHVDGGDSSGAGMPATNGGELARRFYGRTYFQSLRSASLTHRAHVVATETLDRLRVRQQRVVERAIDYWRRYSLKRVIGAWRGHVRTERDARDAAMAIHNLQARLTTAQSNAAGDHADLQAQLAAAHATEAELRQELAAANDTIDFERRRTAAAEANLERLRAAWHESDDYRLLVAEGTRLQRELVILEAMAGEACRTAGMDIETLRARVRSRNAALLGTI